MDKRDRRLQILFVDPAAFMSLFKEGLRVREDYQIIKGLPDDSVLMGTTFDPNTFGVLMVVRSSTFKNIPEGKPLPIIPVHIQPGKAD